MITQTKTHWSPITDAIESWDKPAASSYTRSLASSLATNALESSSLASTLLPPVIHLLCRRQSRRIRRLHLRTMRQQHVLNHVSTDNIDTVWVNDMIIQSHEPAKWTKAKKKSAHVRDAQLQCHESSSTPNGSLIDNWYIVKWQWRGGLMNSTVQIACAAPGCNIHRLAMP